MGDKAFYEFAQTPILHWIRNYPNGLIEKVQRAFSSPEIPFVMSEQKYKNSERVEMAA